MSVTYLPDSVWTGHAHLQGKFRSSHSWLTSSIGLLRNLEGCLSGTGDGHGLLGGLELGMPHLHGVGTIRNVRDGVAPVRLGDGVVRRGHGYHEPFHVRVDLAEQRSGAFLREGVAFRLTLGPGAEVELVAAGIR